MTLVEADKPTTSVFLRSTTVTEDLKNRAVTMSQPDLYGEGREVGRQR